MRKLLAGATVVLFGASAASTASAQLALKGSDTLEDVARGVITDCSDVTKNPPPGTLLPAGSITYAGGGSGTGQGAMLAAPPTQHIAPMSRALNGTTACPVTPPATQGTLDTIRGQQLLIGLDAVVVLHANWLHFGGDLSTDAGNQCQDAITADGNPLLINIPGCTTDGCSPTGDYTFGSWKEVLAMIYGGQNNVTAQAQLLANSGHCSVTTATACTTNANCVAPETCVFTTGRLRNAARINCASPVRKFLADNWGTLFESNTANCGYGPPPAGSTQPECLKLKHAFRRGDSSGTTDTFVTLTGMIGIPVLSTKINGTGPNNCQEAFDAVNATASPFCNGGAQPGTKGWTDYADLDPIRRIADSTNAPRTGLEQIAEGGVAPVNIPPVRWNDNRVDPTTVLVELPEHGGSQTNWGPDLATTQAIFTANEDADLALRKGLGLVLPIEIPTNYADESVAYWAASASPTGQLPVVCDPGVFAGSLITAAKLGQFPACPGGVGFGNCLLPVHKDPVSGALNFNCISDIPVPAKSPLKDERYFNTAVFNSAGKLVKDNFCNPNLTAAPLNCSCAAQARPVSAWFRLHVSRATDLGGVNHRGPLNPSTAPFPTANTCKQFTSTDQIGCLVAANPCSIGFAGREGADKLAPGPVNNFAYRLGAGTLLPPTTDHIVSLLNPDPAATFYVMSRKLFVNRWVDTDPAHVEASATNFTNEETLYSCFQKDSITTPRITQYNFVAVPGGPVVDNACPNNR